VREVKNYGDPIEAPIPASADIEELNG
jgi:hypothetical protein